MCFRRPPFFKYIVFHEDKHFENCKTYSGNLDGSMVPPYYHVQNRRYTFLLFFHIVCSIEDLDFSVCLTREDVRGGACATP